MFSKPIILIIILILLLVFYLVIRLGAGKKKDIEDSKIIPSLIVDSVKNLLPNNN